MTGLNALQIELGAKGLALVTKGLAAMTASYYGGPRFKASRGRTAKRRYWRDPAKARQRVRDYRARKAAEREIAAKEVKP